MVVIIIILITGILLMVCGFFQKNSFEKLKEANNIVIGTVICYETYTHYTDDMNDTSYLPIIKYEVNGISYEIKASNSFGSEETAKSLIGQKVRLYYDPSNPENAIEVGASPGIGLIILGAIMAITSIFAIIKSIL